jgi:hypothetical protein
MLDAATQDRLGATLDRALAQRGLVVERAVLAGGNVRAWAPVPGPALLGRLATFGWRVRELLPDAVDGEPDSEAPYLRLVSDVSAE